MNYRQWIIPKHINYSWFGKGVMFNYNHCIANKFYYPLIFFRIFVSLMAVNISTRVARVMPT